MVTVDIERVFSGGNIFRDYISHPGIVVSGIGVFVVVDYHDDLVRLCESRLDMVVVCSRNYDWSNHNLHVRLVREEAQRSLASCRGIKRLG